MKIAGNNQDSPFRFVDPPLSIAFFFIMLVLLLSLLPVSKEKPAKPDLPVPGGLMVTIEWPPDYSQDIDLWVEGPDGQPVGYSHKGSSIFSYLRDDLGAGTYENFNYEFALGRDLTEGEYIINLHFYAYHSGTGDVPVGVTVILYSPTGVSMVFKGTIAMNAVGQELTAVHFRLDDAHNLVPGSANNSFIAVRNKKKFR
ncbi:MAG: hypothetical protein HYT21_01725 [Candidatus Nealsonbacteria bacterium]|nr:hypothetical protein [Candidatus Nealsonbacteria bacterium]